METIIFTNDELAEIYQVIEGCQRIVQSQWYRVLVKKASRNLPHNKDSAQFICDTADKTEKASMFLRLDEDSRKLTNQHDKAMKTIETIPGNCVLLTPEEAAGVGLFDPLFVKKGGQVDVWSALSAPSPCMVGGTDLAAIGHDQRNFLLCVRREDLQEFDRLKKGLNESLESHGYGQAFWLWEVWIESAARRKAAEEGTGSAPQVHTGQA